MDGTTDSGQYWLEAYASGSVTDQASTGKRNHDNHLQLMQEIIADPLGPSSEILLSLLHGGIAILARTQIPVYAAQLLDQLGNKRVGLQPGVHHLLYRLSTAGQSPSYDLYLASQPLTMHLNTAHPQEVLRRAARTVAELIMDLLRWLEVNSVTDHLRVKATLELVLETCDQIQHGSNSVPGPAPEIIRFSCLLESPVLTERFFIRCTQAQEVIFAAAAILTERAAHDIAYGHVASATYMLHVAAVLLDELLPKTFRMLQPLKIDDWLHIRPLIEKPSAIQSRSYRAMAATIETLHINQARHRFADWEEAHHASYQNMLGKVCRAHERWYMQHLAIVRRYTLGTSDGMTWLTDRLSQLRARGRCEVHAMALKRDGIARQSSD